jgi:hypothetical protein
VVTRVTQARHPQQVVWEAVTLLLIVTLATLRQQLLVTLLLLRQVLDTHLPLLLPATRLLLLLVWVTQGHQLLQGVTQGHQLLQGVTQGHQHQVRVTPLVPVTPRLPQHHTLLRGVTRGHLGVILGLHQREGGLLTLRDLSQEALGCRTIREGRAGGGRWSKVGCFTRRGEGWWDKWGQGGVVG